MSSGQGTYAASLNVAGDVTGYAVPGNDYVRAADGTITTFSLYGGRPLSINAAGAITGYFYTPINTRVGFVRAPDGDITTFSAPGDVYIDTYAESINAAGVVAGHYYDSFDTPSSGFVLATDGTISTFNAPGAGITSKLGTYAASINDAGAITGYYYDANNVIHGFLRTP